VPSGAIRDQRIPALEAPTFGDAAALEHHMRDALRAKMLAHRNPPNVWWRNAPQSLRHRRTILAQVKVVDLNDWIGKIQSKVRVNGGV